MSGETLEKVSHPWLCLRAGVVLFSSAAPPPPTPQQGLYYLFGTAPNPVLGALDFYVAAPLASLFEKKYDAPNFALRDK